MTTTDPIQNILKVYRAATDDQLRHGVEWYTDAHTFARSLDPANVWRAAGIIAALSPRVQWERNMVLAARVYSEGFASGTLGRNCMAADEIHAGALPLDVLRGPKVRAFCCTIADPTDPYAVVVDRHALSVILGHVATDTEQKSYLRRKGYETAAGAYREAALVLGVVPSQVQSVTWCVWRETYARNHAAVAREVNA
jgi:hypothetical protein